MEENKTQKIYTEINNYINCEVKQELLKDQFYREIVASFNDKSFDFTLINLKEELNNIQMYDKFETFEDYLKILIEKELELRKNCINQNMKYYTSTSFLVDVLKNPNYFINLKSSINFESLSTKTNFIKLIHDYVDKTNLHLLLHIFEEIGEKIQKNDYNLKTINYEKVDIYRQCKKNYILQFIDNKMYSELVNEYEIIEQNIENKNVYIKKIFEYMLDMFNNRDYICLPTDCFIWEKNTDLKEIKNWLKTQIKNIEKLNS